LPSGIFPFKKLEGHFNTGFLYGLPKIHKNASDPPLRPVISMVGTATHKIAQKIDSLIKPYIFSDFTVSSSTDFVRIIKSLENTAKYKMCSLDVESLFTNVPVKETIDIIINKIYHNSDHEPLPIPENLMRRLLEICTTKTPFKFNDRIYKQIDGVSMGSPLGPTFANFYMGHLEENFLKTSSTYKPFLYLRYVDDTFLFVESFDQAEKLMEQFENNSVLRFTIEHENDKSIPFLDVLVTNKDKISTKLFIKSTASNVYLNFHSFTTDRYKKSLIKTLLYRIFRLSTSENDKNIEIQRMRQFLVNSNYPLKFIDAIISHFTARHQQQQQQQQQDGTSQQHDEHRAIQDIKLFYRGQWSSYAKVEENRLKHILHNNITTDNRLQICIYYKQRQLASILSEKRSNPLSHTVYNFKCSACSCVTNSQYIGSTVCTLEDRCKNHQYNGAIKRHYLEHHNKRIKMQEILDQMKTRFSSPFEFDLRVAESILIQAERPRLNTRDEFRTHKLNLFLCVNRH